VSLEIPSGPSPPVQDQSPNDADIDKAMSANICRCGTYQCIRRAVHRAAQLMAEGEKE
jgi:isoquinoline 1-oxidoreductase alpha subunit